MPRTLFYVLHRKHRRLARERKGDANWNVTVDEYRQILRRGCFVCGYGFSRDTKTDFYPHRLNNHDYQYNNTVVLCRLCSKMCRSKDPVTLLKQLIHIGSRQAKVPNIEYLDVHRNNTSAESYDKFLEYLVEEKTRETLTEEAYYDMCSDDCEFCGRKDSTLNRNHVKLKLDDLYPDFITTCTSCYALYRCFKGKENFEYSIHDEFLTFTIMCVEKNRYVESYMYGVINIRNNTLYLNHSNHEKNVKYVPGNIRFDNVRNGSWNVEFSLKEGDPFLDLTHDNWIADKHYKTDTILISRANQLIDSFLLTPYCLAGEITYTNQMTSLSNFDDIISLIEDSKYPGQIDVDSKIQIGYYHHNTRIKILIDHENDEAMRIRFYSDSESIEMCECRSIICDKCVEAAITRGTEISLPLEIIYIINHEKKVKLVTPFIKTIKKYISSDDIKINISKKNSENDEEYDRRVNCYIKREKSRLEAEKLGVEYYRRKHNEYKIKLRRSKGIKARVKGSKPQSSYNKSYKEKQIEKYGEETFRKINSLNVKICRLKKKDNTEDKVSELQNELNRLTRV